MALNGVTVYTAQMRCRLKWVRVSFADAASAVTHITQLGAAASNAKIGNMVVYSAVGMTNGAVIPLTEGIVAGDSWTQFWNQAFSTELQALITVAGGTVTILNLRSTGKTSRRATWWKPIWKTTPERDVYLYVWHQRYERYGVGGGQTGRRHGGTGTSQRGLYPRGGTGGAWICYGSASGATGLPWGKWIRADGAAIRPTMSGENVDLSSTNAALYPGKFPIGLSYMSVNPALDPPAGTSIQGMLVTYVDDKYGNPGAGEGFAWQMYLPITNSTYRAAIRFGKSATAGTDWGVWQRMSFIPQAAPAAVSTTALTVSATPTQAEVQAIAQRTLEAVGALNTMRTALITAGILT